MIDPLSLATEGFFTSDSYKNMYPLTLATDGYILSEAGDASYGGSGYPVIFFHPEEKALVEEKQVTTTEFIDEIEVSSEGPKYLVQQPPLAQNIKAISEIIEDRELVMELRRSAIIDHHERELRMLELRERLFKKYKRNKKILLAIMLDEI